MAINKTYKIDLREVKGDHFEQDYLLDDKYFQDPEKIETRGGSVEVNVSLHKIAEIFEVQVTLKGTIKTICDRCLDELICPIDTEEHIIVRMGEEFDDDSEDTIIVPEKEPILDLSWLMYEFVVLSLPMKRVHDDGECNQDMIDRLYDINEDESEPDPRWAELKKLKSKLKDKPE